MKMHICFCIDENYIGHLGAVLCSLKDSNSHNHAVIHVLCAGVSQGSKDKLGNIFDGVGALEIEFHDMQLPTEEFLQECLIHISTVAYLRFDIPEILPHVSKALYLDADVIIADDLREMWEVDIDQYYCGAVENPFFERAESIGLRKEHSYFNAGVMLINMELWRREDVKGRALQFLRNSHHVAKMFDQDALNVAVRGKWKKLSIRWNLQTSYLIKRRCLSLEERDEVMNAFHKPGIIHYSTSSKPWDWFDAHPLRSAYLKYEREFAVTRRFVSFSQILKSIIKWPLLKIGYLYQLS